LRPYVNVTFGVVSKLHALNPTIIHAPFFQLLLQTFSFLSFSCSCLPLIFSTTHVPLLCNNCYYKSFPLFLSQLLPMWSFFFSATTFFLHVDVNIILFSFKILIYFLIILLEVVLLVFGDILNMIIQLVLVLINWFLFLGHCKVLTLLFSALLLGY
jgi:hypothetical protein